MKLARLLKSASALALFVNSGVAFAQVALPAEAEPAPRKEEASSGGLAEIIVTAQRRAENLQRTGLAISAVSSNDLAKANVTDAVSLTKLVPSLISQPSLGSATGFYLRGVGSVVGNAFTDNPVGFNFGPVYIARPAAVLGTFYDLERVEVLKGPQGTLYGRNATGGAINVIPRTPKLGENSADIALEAGNYDAIRAQAAFTIPLGEQAALRVAGQTAKRDGYLSDGYDDEVGQAARASLLFKPSDAWSLTVVADYFHQGGKGTGSVLVPGPLTPNAPDVDDRIGGADPRSIAALTAAFPTLVPFLVSPPRRDGFTDNKFWGVYANLEADLGFATLTIIPSYRDSKPNYLAYNAGYSGRVIERSKQKSLEARLASGTTGRFNYVIGGYYFDEDQETYDRFTTGLLLDTIIDAKLRTKSYAVFGQANFSLFDGFRLIGGARQTWEDKANNTTLTQFSFGEGPTSNVRNKADFKKFTYKAGFEWDAGARNLVYGSIATGFKSGGFFIAAFDNVFAPENLTAYTLGSKNRFFDNKLQFNIEAFYWNYTDQQVNYFGPIRTSPTTIGTGLVTSNAGKSRIYGAEAEVVLQATPADLLTANVQYLNAKYQDFVTIQASPTGAPPRTGCSATLSDTVVLPPPSSAFVVDCSDRQQVNAPKWSFNFSYQHTFALSDDLDFVLGGRTKIESSRFLGTEYLPESIQDSYMQSDLFATLSQTADRWSLTAFVNNVENETVFAGSLVAPITSTAYNVLRPPRTYGMRAAFSF